LISALKARGMYYQGLAGVPEWQRHFAVQQWKGSAEIEPEIIERLAAWTYRFTGEQLWLGRVYSASFWMVGCLFLFLSLRRFVSEEGAMLATAFYLFLPYGVIASRSFQPDPLMVMLIIMFWWTIISWVRTLEPPRPSRGKLRSEAYSSRASGARQEKNKPSRSEPVLSPAEGFLHGENPWAWAVAAGVLGGLAILVKFSAAFFVIGGGLGAVLGRESLKQAFRRPQLWVIVALGSLPGAVYLIYGIFVAGFLGQQFSGRFIPALLISPSYYLNWISTLNHVLGGAALAFALLGLFFFRERSVFTFVTGLWAAYFLYGIIFNYHIWSHDYYNLPLIPIAALSLAPLSEAAMARLTEAVAGSRVKRLLAASILALGLAAVLLDVSAALKSADYRPEASLWSEVGEQLGPQARLVALTEDYGLRLAYWGWLKPAPWPLAGDIAYHADLRGAQDDFDERFERLALKRDFFLVTLPDELDQQPLLKERLAAYPLFVQGEGYVVYDLR
jgi:4-amino-4-deoxy-L-arabinose transferase-like glycosyltransferase